MPWSIADLADAVTEGLHARAREDDLEQTVYGFDCLRELQLHPLIQKTLRNADYGVWPEQRYPSDGTHKKKSHGKRCDITLTFEGLPLRDPEVKGTLHDTIEAMDPEEAFWLEVKTVAQFETSGPFKRYSAELLAPVTHDVKKLWNDGLIRHAGLLLVLFNSQKEIADHDLVAWHRRCLERGYPVGVPAIRGFKISDRVGNAWCSVAMFAVRGA